MGSKKTQKGKKKGGMICLLAFLSVLLALPLSAQAAGLSAALADIPTRVTTGLTLSGGLDDPGEAGAIGLNRVLAVVNANLTVPGLVVSWGDQRVLELGVLSGGYSGASGNDALAPDQQGKGFAFVGVGAYLLEALSANVVYVLDSRAETNLLTYVALDIAALGPKLVSLTSAAWKQPGL